MQKEEFDAVMYSVTIAESEGGTISTDTDSAVAGETVTVTAVPDDGYVLDEILAEAET